MRSMTPGLNGSISTSALATSRVASSRPAGLLTSSAMERLFLARVSTENDPRRSMRMTSAPQSARISPANGPGARPANCDSVHTRFRVMQVRMWYKETWQTSMTRVPARAIGYSIDTRHLRTGTTESLAGRAVMTVMGKVPACRHHAA